MTNDISKLHDALTSVKNLTPEGEIIREDLIGLLEFENGTSHQIDALMIERRKKEKTAIRAAAKKAEPKPAQ